MLCVQVPMGARRGNQVPRRGAEVTKTSSVSAGNTVQVLTQLRCFGRTTSNL